MTDKKGGVSMSGALDKHAPIYVAGHRGMVGSAIVRRLRAGGYKNIITRDRAALDLMDQRAVWRFFSELRPAYVFLAAAKVGGIHANNAYPADFIRENLLIQSNVIDAAMRASVDRLLFLGSSCIYPRDCPQPIREEYLLTGTLERTNEPYAVAKIAGIKLCEAFNRQHGTHYVCVMPTNLYGPHDNYDLRTSHVLPALLRKAHEAKERSDSHLVVWGTGKARREFLYVDDMADACVFLMENRVEEGLFNIGMGEDVTIRELAQEIMRTVGFQGEIVCDVTQPDGTPRKLLSVERLQTLGWQAKTSLAEGIRKTYASFLEGSGRL
jgi:GDP-L-fucose synthase